MSIQSISVTFSEPVNFNVSSFTLYSEGLNPDGSLSGTQTAVSSSAVTATSTDGMTWTISVVAGGSLDRGGGFLADGVYQLVLHGDEITDQATGLAPLGSGDQIVQFNSVEAGGMSNYFHALYGDVDGSGSVGRNSFNAFKAAYGSSLGDSNFNALFDFDGSGSIGRSTFNQFKANYGKSYSY